MCSSYTLPFVDYDERSFYGTWRVSKYEPFVEGAAAKSNDSGIEGTELTLEEGYDVRWKIPRDVEAIPLFSCESYEVILTHPAKLTFINSTAGRIPFSAEFDSLSQLQLTFDKAFILHCEKIPQSETIQEAPFSYLSALENGYFSDLAITSASGKNYHVHRIILKLGCPEQNWESESSLSGKLSPPSYQICPLDGLSDNVLVTVMHFLYSGSIPPSLSETGARECLNAVMKLNGLEKLANLCEKYLENYAVRTQIENLCDELEDCGMKITNFIRLKPEAIRVTSESSALWQGIKCAIREFAVGLLKIVQICKIFSDRRNELSREERHRIMKNCRKRLPNLIMLAAGFYETIIPCLAKQSSEARSELASYFLTEAEPMFDEVTKIISEIRKTLLTIIDVNGTKRRQKESFLAKTLKNAVHLKELSRLSNLHTEVDGLIKNFVLKKEHFGRLNDAEKVEAVSHMIECAAEEFPVVLDRITNLHDNLEARLSWTQWKYYFKMGAAKVAWMIEKSKYSKHSLMEAIGALRKLVERDDFDAALNALGLIDLKKDDAKSASSSFMKQKRPSFSQDVESLCIPPVPRDNFLSCRAEEMLNTSDSLFADMRFVLHFVNNDNENVTQVIPAHRVLVACHCDWFRKALLSGMKEDITREINIYDCSPDLFQHFLRYVYSGRLNCSSIGTEALADLIAISDQYEVDSLKRVCEGALKPRVSSDNVLELITIGDRFNASRLRECCMDYIIQHPDLLQSEIFSELPAKLQADIKELTECNQREMAEKTQYLWSYKFRRGQQRSPSHSQHSPSEDIADLSSEMEMINRLANDLHQVPTFDNQSDDGCTLESCCEGMRDILGDDITLEELEQLAVAADYDVNRAVNFYFNSQLG